MQILSETEHREWEDLDLLASGALYHFIPRIVFRSSTALEVLDISYCPGISQVAIFQAKDNLDDVQHIAISDNRQLTILAVTCLCSCLSIATIQAHDLQLSTEALLLFAVFMHIASSQKDQFMSKKLRSFMSSFISPHFQIVRNHR